MGQPLDGILKKIIDSNFTINSEYLSERFDIDNREQEFSIQFTYDSGISVDMVLKLEGSIDGENFSEITDSDQTITDPSGTHIWDIAGSGLIFLRVKVEVTTGSIDVSEILYSAKRRH
jgi:hypothetical protein